MNPQTLEVPTTASRPGSEKQDLPKTMRAVVAYAPGDYRLETVPGREQARMTLS